MAIKSAIMQMRRGLEADFDPDKMRPGEWAVSTDKKYVRMCFSVGVCVRMATYDAFEEDMAKIEEILSTCETIEEAVSKINTEVSTNAQAVEEYTEQAKKYRDETKQFRDGTETSATNAKTSEDKAKVSETNAKISEENARRVAETLPEDYTELSKAFYNTAIKQKAVGDNIHVTDSAEARNVEFGLYGKAEQNGEPTPDNPIEIVVSGSDGSVDVVSCGKNLFNPKNVVNGAYNNGYINTDSWKITVVHAEPNSDITLSGFSVQSGTFCAYLNSSDYTDFNRNAWNTYNNNGTHTIPSDVEWLGIVYLTDDVGANLQVERGTVATPYEPYTETTSTIPTPNGLAGIKVSSGGNYTDENGQQWICDEVVKYADGSGKRIKKVGVIDSYNGEEITTDYMSTTGQLTTGAKVLYVLPEPIITDLTAEEIAEIEKLHTFYPVTNISNDADCGMSITYLCDAKNYIDQRLALIESAMLNNI